MTPTTGCVSTTPTAATRRSLQAQVDATAEHFGAIDAIGFRPVLVPGTVEHVDYRSQEPNGPFGAPLLELRSGRYPTADGEAAVTDWVADSLDAEIGSTIDLDGVPRTVVGIVENPSDFNDEFVLLPPAAFADSDFVLVLFDGDEGQIQSLRLPGDADSRSVVSRRCARRPHRRHARPRRHDGRVAPGRAHRRCEFHRDRAASPAATGDDGCRRREREAPSVDDDRNRHGDGNRVRARRRSHRPRWLGGARARAWPARWATASMRSTSRGGSSSPLPCWRY